MEKMVNRESSHESIHSVKSKYTGIQGGSGDLCCVAFSV